MRGRRKYPRLKESHRIMVEVQSAPGSPGEFCRTFACASDDISAGGICLDSDQRIPVGTILTARIACQNPPAAFILEGRVVWVRDHQKGESCRVGVEFTGLLDQSLAKWQHYVAGRIIESSQVDGAIDQNWL